MTNPANCKDARESLGAYALGALPSGETGGVRVHLHVCADCSTEYRELSAVVALLGQIDESDLYPADSGPRVPARTSVSYFSG